MTAYYNEHDPKAAAWLHELIAEGLIAEGIVDERSIVDVEPDDLYGFTQCHFFAGIGGWSLALRLAGWPDDRPVWTGSCPCQPFSAAGKGDGFTDPRHLWPEWYRLIRECRPATLLGEQVDAAIRHGWLDLVAADLEAIDYAFGAIGLPAAGVEAPHIRSRLWFVADTGHGTRRRGITKTDYESLAGGQEDDVSIGCGGEARELADTANTKRRGGTSGADRAPAGNDCCGCWAGELVNAVGARLERLAGDGDDGDESGRERTDAVGSVAATSGAGFWSDCDWIPCRDGFYRPVEPGSFPLAHGVSARVGRLRGYGNAIVPQVAAEVIRAYIGISEGA